MHTRRLILPFVAFLLSACGGDSSDPTEIDPTPIVSTVEVTPAADTLTALGATVQFTATARDAGGNTVSGQTFTWTSSAPAVATVDASGLATAITNGTTTIGVSVAGVSNSASLTVALLGPVDRAPRFIDACSFSPCTSVSQFGGGDLVTQPAGSTFAMRAQVLNIDEVPIPDLPVRFIVTDGGGTVSNVDATTDTEGIAETQWTWGAGFQRLQIEVDALGWVGVVGTATVSQVVSTVEMTPAADTFTALGSTVHFTATARDASGNTVPVRISAVR